MFQELLSQLYALEYYYKTAHWTVKNPQYYADHLLFDRLSDEASKRIDQVAEKGIGLTQNSSIVHLPSVLKMMFNLIKDLSYSTTDNAAYFQDGLKLETALIELCKKFNAIPGTSVGTQNMLQDIIDETEGRIYLIKQRLK